MTDEQAAEPRPQVEYTSLGIGPWYVLLGKRPNDTWTISVLEGEQPVASFDTIRDGNPSVAIMRPGGKPRAALVGGEDTELILYDEEGQIRQVLSIAGIEQAIAEATEKPAE